jgi:hypothetical protein
VFRSTAPERSIKWWFRCIYAWLLFEPRYHFGHSSWWNIYVISFCLVSCGQIKQVFESDHSYWQPKSSMQLQRPLSELQYYKVLGVINTIMLVLNTLEDRCYIMKVLHKSPCPVSDLKCSIVPQDVPYMVKLHGYFETESAVFLLLQHARYENHLILCYLKWCLTNQLIVTWCCWCQNSPFLGPNIYLNTSYECSFC